MRFTTLTLVSTLFMLTAGCSSTFERIVYRPDINQGNYLTTHQVSQIHQGMTQEQVQFILGTPMLRDSFGSNTWFYVFRQQPSRGATTQENLILTFDSSAKLVDIKHQPNLDVR